MSLHKKHDMLVLPVLVVIGLIVLALFILRDLEAPMVYNSNSATLRSGEVVCAFVDTKEGKKPCDAFSLEERSKMEHRWAE